MKVVQLIRNRGLGFQIRNYFTPTTYRSCGSTHAHCQFCDFRLKSQFFSKTVRDRLMEWMLWNVNRKSGGGSVRVGSGGLEWPLIRVSRSRYTYKSNISQMVREFSIVQWTAVDHQGIYRKRAKNWGRCWIFFAKTVGRCFTPVTEIKPNTVTPDWNFYTDIQFIRGKFWLQLWTLKKFSEPRVSRNHVAKKWKMAKLHLFAAITFADLLRGFNLTSSVLKSWSQCTQVLGFEHSI